MSAGQPPAVVDALQLLGYDQEVPVETDDVAADGDEEIFAANEGTDADRAFDAIVGVLEEVLMCGRVEQLIARSLAEAAPLTHTSEHDQFIRFKALQAAIEDAVDEEVRARLPDTPLEEIARLITERHDEVSPDVADMIEGALIEFEEFRQRWKHVDRSRK